MLILQKISFVSLACQRNSEKKNLKAICFRTKRISSETFVAVEINACMSMSLSKASFYKTNLVFRGDVQTSVSHKKKVNSTLQTNISCKENKIRSIIKSFMKDIKCFQSFLHTFEFSLCKRKLRKNNIEWILFEFSSSLISSLALLLNKQQNIKKLVLTWRKENKNLIILEVSSEVASTSFTFFFRIPFWTSQFLSLNVPHYSCLLDRKIFISVMNILMIN